MLKNINNRYFYKIFLCIFVLSLIFVPFGKLSASTNSNTTATPTDSFKNPILDYTLDVNSDSVIVVESGRNMILYNKNSDLKTNIPIASKLMTALLAVESIPPGTMVTVSSVASSQKDASKLSLKTGEKYSLKYLLYGLILKNNNAAGVALAEQLSGTEEEFVELMNTKAKSFQMNDTVFMNVTGEKQEGQFTTVTDVARLLRFATSITQIDEVLKTQDSVFILSPTLTKHLISDSKDIWTFAENTTGAFSDNSSYCASAKSGQINIWIIGVSEKKITLSSEINKISSSIFTDYEYSTLAVAFQSFPERMKVSEKEFSLRFGNSIYYIHPKSVDFIHDTIYEPFPEVDLPILTSKSVASVTFVLLDGTRIIAELFPAVNIWSDSGIKQKLLDIYNTNKDIVHIAFVLFFILILVGIYKIIFYINTQEAISKK